MAYTSNPTKVSKRWSDVLGEVSSEEIISQKIHIPLFLSTLSRQNPEKNPTQNLSSSSLLQFFSFFHGNNKFFQAIVLFQYFSGNLTQDFLN